MNKFVIKILILSFVFIGCDHQKSNKTKQNDLEIKSVKELSKKAFIIPKDLVIAHRGTTYWAPEETEPSYRWARNMGADYLELDLQLTKDNILVAFHDNDLKRTTNIEDIFPDRANLGIHDFTLIELRSLDAGSWFNKEFPERARESFKNQPILTLQDVVMIAEGYRLKRNKGIPEKELVDGIWYGNYLYEPDTHDNGNRPGIYPETKHPKLNVESLLAKKLTDLGWNINTNPKKITTKPDKVSVANSEARVILQSFSPESIEQLEKFLPNIPKCFLLWKPEMEGDLKDVYQQVIHFAKKNNVQIIGSSIAGEPNNYGELTAPWMTDMLHKADLQIHAYTFDTDKQANEYKNRVEGMFTNRADLALTFNNRNSLKSVQEVLIELGY